MVFVGGSRAELVYANARQLLNKISDLKGAEEFMDDVHVYQSGVKGE